MATINCHHLKRARKLGAGFGEFSFYVVQRGVRIQSDGKRGGKNRQAYCTKVTHLSRLFSQPFSGSASTNPSPCCFERRGGEKDSACWSESHPTSSMPRSPLRCPVASKGPRLLNDRHGVQGQAGPYFYHMTTVTGIMDLKPLIWDICLISDASLT